MSILQIRRENISSLHPEKEVEKVIEKEYEPDFEFSDLFVEPEESSFLSTLAPWISIILSVIILIVLIVKK